MERRRILVVDDEVHARTALAEPLRDEGYDVETAGDAFKALGKYEAFAPHVVVTDLSMPGMNGIELVEKLRAQAEPPEIVVMSGHGDTSTAVAALNAGAADYLPKPIQFDEFLAVIAKAIERNQAARELREMRARLRQRVAPGQLVADAPAMQRVMEIVDQVAPTKASVLVTGESGTGKELIANAIHARSVRADGPFVKLHCSGFSEAALDAELFGEGRKGGRLALAAGGTLFLDEISEMPTSTQVKLLGVLVEHGPHDVRVIAATIKNLADEVKAGRFREALLQKLQVVTIDLPALRDRACDIPLLAQQFVERHAKHDPKPGVSQQALELLASYDWPGNVSELEHAIERAIALATGSMIEPRHLPPNVRPAAHQPSGMPPIPGSTLDDIERYAILESLKATNGSTSKAAEMLGISVRTIQYRLHDYNIAPRAEVNGARKPTRPSSEPGNAKS